MNVTTLMTWDKFDYEEEQQSQPGIQPLQLQRCDAAMMRQSVLMNGLEIRTFVSSLMSRQHRLVDCILSTSSARALKATRMSQLTRVYAFDQVIA
jgi:hypothetical protein